MQPCTSYIFLCTPLPIHNYTVLTYATTTHLTLQRNPHIHAPPHTTPCIHPTHPTFTPRTPNIQTKFLYLQNLPVTPIIVKRTVWMNNECKKEDFGLLQISWSMQDVLSNFFLTSRNDEHRNITNRRLCQNSSSLLIQRKQPTSRCKYIQKNFQNNFNRNQNFKRKTIICFFTHSMSNGT